MIKKGVSLLMALALCLTLLPASALAAEAQGQAGQEQTVLTQGNDGQTQVPGQGGAGEDDKTSDEAPDKAPDKAPDEEPDEAVSAVQALIDALPAAEDISDANADEVSGQLDAIDEAKQALTEEQAARLDLTGYDAAAAAVLALAGEPDANEPAVLADTIGIYLRLQSEEARNAFIGRYYFLDSLKEVAAYCGMSESKCKSLLYRTRVGLKEYLEKEGFSV